MNQPIARSLIVNTSEKCMESSNTNQRLQTSKPRIIWSRVPAWTWFGGCWGPWLSEDCWWMRSFQRSQGGSWKETVAGVLRVSFNCCNCLGLSCGYGQAISLLIVVPIVSPSVWLEAIYSAWSVVPRIGCLPLVMPACAWYATTPVILIDVTPLPLATPLSFQPSGRPGK